jgi:hypothetical protein
MAESNPGATGLAPSTSMRCSAKRRPGGSAPSVVERALGRNPHGKCPVAALSLLRCVYSRPGPMTEPLSERDGADLAAGFSRRRAGGIVWAAELQASGSVRAAAPTDNTLSVTHGALARACHRRL